MKKQKILILYLGIGSGHRVAAENIKEVLHRKHPQAIISCRDPLFEAFPRVYKSITTLYLRLLRSLQFCWNFLYESPKAVRSNKKLIHGLLGLAGGKFAKVMSKENPDVVIATHAFYAGLVADYKKQYQKQVPLIAVTTDFFVHQYWLYDEVTQYSVAHEQAKGELIKSGIDPEKIKVTGIPVIKKKGKHNPGQKQSILICGGGFGSGNIDQLVKHLKRQSSNVVWHIITGSNKRLFKKIKELLKNSKISYKLEGYHHDLHQLMSSATLYIGNAGGMITSELLLYGVPMILYKPIPGQEKRNAQYLQSKGAAVIAVNKKELLQNLSMLLHHKEKRVLMQKKELLLTHPHAVETMVQMIGALMPHD